MTPKYSDLHHINEAMIGLVACLGGNPYVFPPPRTGTANMGIADMIAKIRERFGDEAAASIKITVH